MMANAEQQLKDKMIFITCQMNFVKKELLTIATNKSQMITSSNTLITLCLKP